MKILVTGAAGLIGSHVCDILLDEGHVVIGVDDFSYGKHDNLFYAKSKPNFSLIEKTITERTKFDGNYDFIFHLASYKKTFGKDKGFNNSCDFSDVMLNNSKMINFLFNGSQNPKVIFTGTSDVYGNHETFKEHDDITFQAPTTQRQSYALVKLFEEQVLLNAHYEGKMEVAIARIFGCCSERSGKDWTGGHVPLFIDRAKRNLPIEIHGDGNQTRSMGYAPEIAADLVSMMYNFDKCSGDITNIGSTEEMSVLEHAQIIIEAVGSKSEIKFLPKDEVFGNYKEIQRRKPNLYFAETRLNATGKTPFREFIHRII